MHIIQSEPFEPAEILAQFDLQTGKTGAMVQFCGVVREDDGIKALELEHYPEMTQKALNALEQNARQRFSIQDVFIIHRIGKLHIGELIMMVAVSAVHRKDAFKAADFLMDHLKSRVPFWKRAHKEGGADWIAAKDQDERALKRW